MEKLVSAVITTRNRLNLLKRAIDSVLTQTYPYIECIVVSDASDDGTNEYCSQRNDIHFISIPKTESHGGNYARNLGIKAAKGHYVAFLDDDDYWFPDKIKKQVSLIEKKHCECVYCLRQFEIVKNGKIIKTFLENTNRKIEGNISKKIFRHSFTQTSCIMATKNVLEKVGMFDEQVIKMQEYELLVRIAQVSEIYYWKGEPLLAFTADKDDKKRVSYGFNKFPKARKYIKQKHRELIKKSGFLNYLLFYDWEWTAMFRCARSEKKWKTLIMYGPYFFISLAVHKIFNINISNK